MSIAYIAFTLLDGTSKLLTSYGYPVAQVTFMRYLIHVLLIVPFLVAAPSLMRAQRPALQGLRALLLCTATLCNFYAIQSIQLSKSAAIFFSIPLLVALLAIPILSEKIGPRRWGAILFGFVGILVITRPDSSAFGLAELAIMVSALALAGYQITTRMVAGEDHDLTGLFFAGIGGALVLLPVQPSIFIWPVVDWHWLLFGLCGFAGTGGHMVLLIAHRMAPAPILAPAAYQQLLYMILFDYFVFHDIPDQNVGLGAMIVLASSLYLWLRERQIR
ncbi:MAG: DMT family transporter [Pseudomonadota bacterium]